jgi:Trk K+ transport system NAD-binding subunit
MSPPRLRRRFRPIVLARYAIVLGARFRYTLLLLFLLVVVGTIAFWIPPHNGARVSVGDAMFAAWMALFAQSVWSPPETWYLDLLGGLYPLFGFVLVGEGIVRLSLLLVSREQGQKEWMKVMASTYRDHIVLCGLGHLGYRVLQQLLATGAQVVAIEKDASAKFLTDAKATGIPVLVRDMKEDQALIDAGVPHARCIVIATNDDMANLEVALDARRMNPAVRVLMRMFDQQIASKIKDAMEIDEAFSSAALAAPIVAAMSTGGRVLASYPIAGVSHAAAEITVEAGAPLAGVSLAELESRHQARVLAHLPAAGAAPSPPDLGCKLSAGDRVIVHVAAAALPPLRSAARGT